MRCLRIWLLGLGLLMWIGGRTVADEAFAIADDATTLDGIVLAAADDQGEDKAEESADDDEKADDGDQADEGEEKAEEGGGQEDAEMDQLNGQDDELEQQTSDAAERFKNADNPAEKAGIRENLVRLVNEHFDVRQKRRELEIQRLEEELKNLREAIEKRSAARDKIVERRLEELIGEDGDDLSF
jgi:hypothetical protein